MVQIGAADGQGATAEAPISVALHIGAHKTASTHLQHSMILAEETLDAAGVRFYGPPHLRQPGQWIAAQFGAAGGGGESAAARLARLAAGARRVVLSEENFAGALLDDEGRLSLPLYQKAEDRVAALAAALAPVPVSLFLAIREPGGFLVSAYSQSLLSGRCVPFDDFRRESPAEAIDWAALLARLAGVRGLAGITVWRFEDHAGVFADVCARLMGTPNGTAVRPIGGRVHPGLSERAVRQVLAWHAEGRTGRLAHRARSLFPVGPDEPAFAPLREGGAALQASYDAQVARIAAMPGVVLLRPPPRAARSAGRTGKA